MQTHTFQQRVDQILAGSAALLAIAIVILNSSQLPDSFHQKMFLGRPLILLLTLTIFLTLIVVSRWMTNLNVRQRRWILGTIISASLLIQLWSAFTIFGDNIYDGMDIRIQAINMLHGSRTWIAYFHNLAENNVPVTILQFIIFKIAHLFHINQWVFINLVMFAWADLGFLALYKVVKHYASSTIATLTLLISAGYFPFYAFALFYYTDGLAYVFPLLAIWLSIRLLQAKTPRSISLNAISLGILLAAGFWIKGNNIVTVIAIIWILMTAKRPLRTKITLSLTILICAGLAYSTTPTLKQHFGYTQPSTKKMPVLTWTMMGLNSATKGATNQQDTHLIQAQPTYTKKQKLVNTIIRQRLTKMGPVGLAKQFIFKTNLMWGYGPLDATDLFQQVQHYDAWYSYLFGSQKRLLNTWLAALYSVMWLGFVVECWRLITQRKPFTLFTRFSLLMFLGIYTFHIFFWEVEARYSLIVLPLIIGLAAAGLTDIATEPVITLTPKRQSQLRWTVLGVLTICAFLGLKTSWSFTRPAALNQPVVQQEKGYGTLVIHPGQTVTQVINLPASANALRIQSTNQIINKPASLKILFKSHTGLQRLTWSAKDHAWQKLHHFSSGKQTLVINNPTGSTRKLTVLKSGQYRSLPQVRSLKPATQQVSLQFSFVKIINRPIIHKVTLLLLVASLYAWSILICLRYRFPDYIL
ncbi:glycosyltransferase family 39 protein [Furfurilactobacillus curtus]|uniref:Glycosyltransferase RgtA/B/C/D-like domain-containing protein n=1 Tax=Furfurilactobacillus curtus TaxID=1746200 RepID=A0ABQ5JSI4_9LACO